MSPLLPRDPQDDEAYEIVEDDGQAGVEEDDLFEAGEADDLDPLAKEMDFSEPVIHDRTSLEGQQFRDLQAAFTFLQEQRLFSSFDTVRDALRHGNLVLGNVVLITRRDATIVLTEEGIKSILGELDD